MISLIELKKSRRVSGESGHHVDKEVLIKSKGTQLKKKNFHEKNLG